MTRQLFLVVLGVTFGIGQNIYAQQVGVKAQAQIKYDNGRISGSGQVDISSESAIGGKVSRPNRPPPESAVRPFSWEDNSWLPYYEKLVRHYNELTDNYIAALKRYKERKGENFSVEPLEAEEIPPSEAGIKAAYDSLFARYTRLNAAYIRLLDALMTP